MKNTNFHPIVVSAVGFKTREYTRKTSYIDLSIYSRHIYTEKTGQRPDKALKNTSYIFCCYDVPPLRFVACVFLSYCQENALGVFTIRIFFNDSVPYTFLFLPLHASELAETSLNNYQSVAISSLLSTFLSSSSSSFSSHS